MVDALLISLECIDLPPIVADFKTAKLACADYFDYGEFITISAGFAIFWLNSRAPPNEGVTGVSGLLFKFIRPAILSILDVFNLGVFFFADIYSYLASFIIFVKGSSLPCFVSLNCFSLFID